MKVLLVGINSKFIHPNVAIRLLHKNTNVQTRLMEFTIKDASESIVTAINNSPEEIVGLSVYIWNVRLIKKILPHLKKRVLLGGPEVSYESNKYFNYPIEWIIKGEGEQAFEQLFSSQLPLEEINGLSYKKNGAIVSNPIVEHPVDNILFANDINFHPSQIQYIETSRGCPFKCSFCMASLEKTVRNFPMENVLKQIHYVIENGAKTIKFLDRTFNLNVDRSIQIIQYIIDNHKPYMSFQFEITGEILDKRIMSVIHTAPKNLFRFEIGIQSTLEETNEAVHRRQNTSKLFKTIRTIQQKNIVDLHLDLIAGLPFESLNQFKETFNLTFALHAKELQLGFLKLLPGTVLKSEANQHDYIYQDAPYEIQSSKYLSTDDIATIKLVEDGLEHTWNKGYMNKTLLHVTENNAFDFFHGFAKYMQSNFKGFRVQLDVLFQSLDNYTDQKQHQQLMLDYLTYHSIKPKRWWKTLPKQEKNKVLKEFQLKHPEYTLQSLYKYATVEPGNPNIIAYYHPDEKFVKEMA